MYRVLNKIFGSLVIQHMLYIFNYFIINHPKTCCAAKCKGVNPAFDSALVRAPYSKSVAAVSI